jgi:hypothetical protein
VGGVEATGNAFGASAHIDHLFEPFLVGGVAFENEHQAHQIIRSDQMYT